MTAQSFDHTMSGLLKWVHGFFIMKHLIFIFILLIVTPNVAFAYIDPGSGSAIMSAIIGFFVAIGLVIKTFWYKIKAFFTGNKSTEDQDTDE